MARQESLNEEETWSRRSVATVDVGGRTYSAVTVANCRVCQHPERLAIEEAIVKGAGCAATARSIDGGQLTGRNIAEHLRRGHLPVRNEAVARVREGATHQREAILDSGADVVADHLSFASLVLGRVRDRVLAGEIEPDIRDGLRAAQMLAAASEDDGDTWREADIVQGFVRHVIIAKEVMGEGLFRTYVARLQADPTLRMLLARSLRSDVDATGGIESHPHRI